MVDIRKQAIKFAEKLEESGICQIPFRQLRLACYEFLQTTDRGTIPLFIEYLEEIGIVRQISNGKQPVYEVNYEKKNLLKEGALSWLLTKEKKYKSDVGTPIENPEVKSLQNQQEVGVTK